ARSPLEHPRRGLSVRLACVKHAASVRPEPGSNSPNKNCPENHWQNKPHPQTGKTGCGKNKNNKQKPPNTLLSSQTTHPLSGQPCQGTTTRSGMAIHALRLFRPGPWCIANTTRSSAEPQIGVRPDVTLQVRALFRPGAGQLMRSISAPRLLRFSTNLG